MTRSLAKIDVALFKQRVVECPDTCFCALDAYNKLCDMLPTKSGPTCQLIAKHEFNTVYHVRVVARFRTCAYWLWSVRQWVYREYTVCGPAHNTTRRPPSAYGPTMSATSNIGSALGVATSLLHPPSALVVSQVVSSSRHLILVLGTQH